MSIMCEADAANTTPGSGNMSLLNNERMQNGQAYAHPTLKCSERQPCHYHILVVENDPGLATLEARVLAAYGYTVVIADTGERAVATLHTSIPDLVVLDLDLPGSLNGWDVLQALRGYATIPVLLTTSSVTAIRKHIRSRGETKRTLDHLPKPYPMQTLLKRIERMLMIAS
jgi:DNA-binding response OmpR family regulator